MGGMGGPHQRVVPPIKGLSTLIPKFLSPPPQRTLISLIVKLQSKSSQTWSWLCITPVTTRTRICPTKNLSCYGPDFDETLKVASWGHLEQILTVNVTFVQATFAQVTFVHRRLEEAWGGEVEIPPHVPQALRVVVLEGVLEVLSLLSTMTRTWVCDTINRWATIGGLGQSSYSTGLF